VQQRLRGAHAGAALRRTRRAHAGGASGSDDESSIERRRCSRWLQPLRRAVSRRRALMPLLRTRVLRRVRRRRGLGYRAQMRSR
jgi:hypothetical protein